MTESILLLFTCFRCM